MNQYADLSKLIPKQHFQELPSPKESSDQGQWLLFLRPTPRALERLKGSWRYHLVIKAPSTSSIAQYVGAYFRQRKPDRDVRVSIDIDPINLL